MYRTLITILHVGATPKKKSKPSISSANVIKIKKNTRRDGVDEYCRQNNIKYKRWAGTKGKGLHPLQIKNAKTLWILYQKVSSQILIAFCAQWKKLFKATQT